MCYSVLYQLEYNNNNNNAYYFYTFEHFDINWKKTAPNGFDVLIIFPQHPVYCVDVVGTQNAHNIISISTDGKMCSWSLDMLSQPQVPVYLNKAHYRPQRSCGKIMFLHLQGSHFSGMTKFPDFSSIFFHFPVFF